MLNLPMAISPLDSRYRDILKDLPTDEHRLRAQLEFEYKWTHHIAKELNHNLTDPKPFVFTQELVKLIKSIEAETKHDVKAMELAVARTFFHEKDHWLVHLGRKVSRIQMLSLMKPYFGENLHDLYKLFDLEDLVFHINTSNPNKQQEFKRMFEKEGTYPVFTNVDLEEPQSDPYTIITYKATKARDQLNNTISVVCEDSSLFVDGEEEKTGVNIKWVMDHLNDYDGKGATFQVVMGCSDGKDVHIYEGKVRGTIRQSKERSAFGFDNHFIPDGQTVPYSSSKPDKLNPRYIAIQHLFDSNECEVRPCIHEWTGSFQ